MADLKKFDFSRTALFWIPPDDLKVKPGLNGRELTAPDNVAHIEWIASQIAEHGFMQSKPLEVFTEGDDVFLADGHCRLAAVALCRSRGVVVEKIPCIKEAKGTSEIDRILNQGAHNSAKKLSPVEEGRNLKRAIGMGLSVAEVAKRIGRSISYVNQHLDFLAAPVEVHGMVAAGSVSATLASEIIRREGAAKGEAKIRAAVETAKAAGKTRATKKHVETTPDKGPQVMFTVPTEDALKIAALVLAREFIRLNHPTREGLRVVEEITIALGEYEPLKTSEMEAAE